MEIPQSSFIAVLFLDDAQEQRVTPSYYTQGSHPGVSLEYMVRLSNEMGADPWFSIPINATDNYIQNFVQYVSDAWK